MIEDKSCADRVETYLSAGRLDFPSDAGNDLPQAVCADMGLTLIEDGFRSPVPGKNAEHLIRPAGLIIDLSVQLTV